MRVILRFGSGGSPENELNYPEFSAENLGRLPHFHDQAARPRNRDSAADQTSGAPEG